MLAVTGHDSRTRAYETLDPDQAAARRAGDAVAACAARQIKAYVAACLMLGAVLDVLGSLRQLLSDQVPVNRISVWLG